MTKPVTIVWFRHDLRIADNPALTAAAARGAVAPVYVWAPDEEGDWPPGGASQWWLHHSLASLARQLADLGSPLIIRRGPTLATFDQLREETGAGAVFWNRRYEPASIERDTLVKNRLAAAGVRAESFSGSLLFEPWTILTKESRPYQVFTPFWKACLAQANLQPPATTPAPEKLASPSRPPASLSVAELALLPRIPWDRRFYETWNVGAPAAEARLARFVASQLAAYGEERNRVDVDGFSRLSPHLRFGEISPRQVWAAAAPRLSKPSQAAGAKSFLSEIGWREFAYHLLFHFPRTPTEPLRENFRQFPWQEDGRLLQAWRRGRTGYPIVDAAMRDLWATGFMPNRARMIVASFLTKDLLLPWQCGARWFWDTLVDADLASNTLGWQWTAGCGADAAPFFRIFNPASQAAKFDEQGDYVRRWIPELAGLKRPLLDEPWKASPEELRAAGVELGVDYPRPLVDHGEARARALAAFERNRSR
jgi:deoxyribodipyrimidine photo-lyase